MATEWDDSLPWRRFNSMMLVFSSLPTLPLHEWTCRYLLFTCCRHALETGKRELLATACFNQIKFPAQATIMLGPRQALHELEFLSCALYISALAARRHGGVFRGAIGEAAIAGLLTHLFSAPADISGPRFLWWTWHENHPTVKEKVLNFPVSQGIFEMSSGFAFSLICGWICENFRRSPIIEEDSLSTVLKEVIHWLPEQNRPLANLVSKSMDSIREYLINQHPATRIAFMATSVPVLHTILSGFSQIFAMDRIGCPSVRSYKFMMAALAFWASSSPMRPLPVKINDSKAGARLAATVVAYFAVQAMIPLVGDATKHLSTGVHQLFGQQTGLLKRDIFGNRYEENISVDDSKMFTIEGATRTDMVQDLEEKRQALDDVSKFLRAADKRVGDCELALQETIAWSKQAQRQVPHLGETELIREMEATNSVRVARIKTHLEQKLDRVKIERGKIASFEQKLRSKIAHLEDILEVGSIDPAGNSIVPASTFGPASVWYTIRGLKSSYNDEIITVSLLCALGMTAFTKSLSFGA